MAASAAAVAVVYVPGSAWRAVASWAAVYFVIWWVVLFAVLPFGVRSQIEEGSIAAGSEPGAPADPRLAAKALWTTILAGIVLVLLYFAAPLIFPE